MEDTIHSNKTEGLATSRATSKVGSSHERGGSTLDNIKSTVAEKLYSAADTLQQKAGQTNQPDSTMATYGTQASEWLNRSADYIRDMDVNKVKSDVQNEVKRNPGRSLLIATAAGLVLGAIFRRR
ncbi:MAG TPA: hypothetical protein VNH22_14965 [Blastocatellia bacterium]|jgi:ElaB/YqjD/DUF883 family membrane-anchored ribosome-binding protein|nr:hypothetical protein [Blastocatellia bacterium]